MAEPQLDDRPHHLEPECGKRHAGTSQAHLLAKIYVILNEQELVLRWLERGLAAGRVVTVIREGVMEINERQAGRITIIKICGQAIINSQPERLSQLVRERLQAGQRLFVLNLADCQRIDSTGLGELVKAYKLVTDCDGVLKLADIPLRLRGLVIVSNLVEVMEICDTEQQAINSFGS